MFKLQYPVVKKQDFIIVAIAQSHEHNGWDSETF